MKQTTLEEWFDLDPRISWRPVIILTTQEMTLKPSPLTAAEQEALKNPSHYEVTSFVDKRGGEPDRIKFRNKGDAIEYKRSNPRRMLFVVGKNGLRVIRTLEDI